MEQSKMISEMALTYVSKTTKNIADLEKVDVTEQVMEYEGEDFSYYYIERENERYRVPVIVFKQLKAQLNENPSIKSFKVTKEGEGKTGTVYTVIPFV